MSLVERAADVAIVAELRARVLAHPEWTVEQLVAGLGAAVKAKHPAAGLPPDLIDFAETATQVIGTENTDPAGRPPAGL